MSRYYKILCPELNAQLQKGFEDREENLDQMIEFSESVGGDSQRVFTSENPGARAFAIYFNASGPPDPENWKKVRGNEKGLMVPRATKGGKLHRARMDELSRASVSQYDFGLMIGMEWHHAPGIKSKLIRKGSKKRKFFVMTPDSFRVKKKFKDKIARISDIEWEKIK